MAPDSEQMFVELSHDADLCVKCGMCLPHCPTYQKTRNENESPRGRIALLQAWANGSLKTSATLDKHIGNCLLCRSCEKVCPASVPYARLVDEYRANTAKPRKHSLALALVKAAIHRPILQKRMPGLLGYYRQSRIAAMLRTTHIAAALGLTPLERLIAAIPQTAPEMPQPSCGKSTNKRGRVGLFTGCMGELFDGETLAAAERVLTSAGYEVFRPAAQTCCGALDLHSGDRQAAQQLEKRNSTVFEVENLDALVTVASGCGATLQEYRSTDFAAKVIDISRFLLQTRALAHLSFAPLPARILVHTPCSLTNVMHDEQSVAGLLQLLPNAEIASLPNSIKCCGSAGSYMLDHPDMAQTLLCDILTAVREFRPRYLVTSNIGCTLHIRAGLLTSAANIEVLHPVVLLDRALRGFAQ